MLFLGWALCILAVSAAAWSAYHSVMSHRGMRVLVMLGPATVLAILSVITGAIPWLVVVPIALVDGVSWHFQAARRR